MNSSYTVRNNLDILQIVENDIAKYSKLGKILIMGDTNARTGSGLGQIDNNDKHIPVPLHSDRTRVLRHRNSQDLHICPRGKEVIDICIEANLNILNGKTFGDMFGKYTSFQYNRNSVADYCIISENVVNDVIYFHVHDHIPYLSDHAKISLKLIASINTKEDKTYDVPKMYKWYKDSAFLFQKAFDTPEVRQQVRKFIYFILYSENQCKSKLDKICIFIDMKFHLYQISLISKLTCD